MKKLIISCLFLVFAINNSFSQKKDVVEYQQNWEKQRMYWGYYLGLNMKSYNISYKKYNSDFVDVTPEVGFNIGLIGNLSFNRNISLRLEPGLSSNTKVLDFTHIEGGDNDTKRNISSTYLRIPLLLKFNTNRYNNLSPYAVAGFSYDYNFSSNQDNSDDNETGGGIDSFRMKKSNFMYEIGFGIDFYLPYFVFSPSIRGIFAINNELVYDENPSSPYTGNIAGIKTRGVFLNLAFH